jgi:teichuronic acid biosynthesis glycosyltransferase TuaC
MKSICFICNRYPHILTPTRHVFVQKLVWALADMGVECTVIAPVPVNQYLSTFSKQPVEAIEETSNGAKIKLYFPRYISFGQRNLFGIRTSHLTTNAFHKVVEKTWKKHGINPEIVYGHFLVPAGITAARMGKKYNIPSFAAYGEATPRDLHVYGLDKLRQEISNLKGIISVSSANEAVLNERNLLKPDRIKVFPNGIRGDKFFPKDKDAARKKFGFDKDAFLAVFVGQFNHRKGILRVADALEGLENVEVAFAGSGKLEPKSSNCIYKKPVIPSDMPDFLSTADVFIMPTLNEGCSNAIVEAMSCGLPVISSNLPFNDDILGPDNAILLDPNNVSEIRKAAVYLKENPEIRAEMKKQTLARAQMLTIEARANNIKNWIEEMSAK